MKKILAFGTSNSKRSINKILAIYAAQKIANSETVIVDLNNYSLPIYSIDSEETNGIPEAVIQFDSILKSVDGIIISLAEHNGNFTAVFKNLFDWLSRIDNGEKVWKYKPMLLLGTSPGPRGATNVLNIAKTSFPYAGSKIITEFSLPTFYQNFIEGKIINEKFESSLNEKIEAFEEVL